MDIDQFGALVREEDPWSVSGTSRANLRNWGSRVLSVGDNPLLAVGELGEGRVVWSGMNLISHILAYDIAEEKRLLEGFLTLLFNGCGKLLDIGRNWNTLSYMPIQSIPNMLNG